MLQKWRGINQKQSGAKKQHQDPHCTEIILLWVLVLAQKKTASSTSLHILLLVMSNMKNYGKPVLISLRLFFSGIFRDFSLFLWIFILFSGLFSFLFSCFMCVFYFLFISLVHQEEEASSHPAVTSTSPHSPHLTNNLHSTLTSRRIVIFFQFFLCFFFQHIWGPFLKWQPPSCQDSYVPLQRIFPIHYKDGQRPGWRGKKGRKEVKVCVLRPVIRPQWFTWRNHLAPGARLQIPFIRFICTILENSSGKRERGRTEAVTGKTLSVRQNWALARALEMKTGDGGNKRLQETFSSAVQWCLAKVKEICRLEGGRGRRRKVILHPLWKQSLWPSFPGLPRADSHLLAHLDQINHSLSRLGQWVKMDCCWSVCHCQFPVYERPPHKIHLLSGVTVWPIHRFG